MRRPNWTSYLRLASTFVVMSGWGAMAQEQPKKVSKGSGQYEEHYELLPPEAADAAAPPAANSGANLDPEGDAQATPRPPNAKGKPAPAASHKGPFLGTRPSSADKPQADEAPASPAAVTGAAPPAAPAEPTHEASRNRSLPANVAPTQNLEKAQPSQGDTGKRPGAASPRGTASSTDASFFQGALAGQGAWIDHGQFGKVFSPKVDDAWRPYTRGRWSFADDWGWVWVSQDAFGWATDHYGRWTYDAEKRWLWIPGETWAPAWVVWRQGEDAIGWAPLPPNARVGDKASVDANAIESDAFARNWVFVDPRYFGQPGMSRYVRQPRWTSDLVARTFPTVGLQVTGERVSNLGLDVKNIERLAGKPVARVRVSFSQDSSFKAARSTSDALTLYRPDARRLHAVDGDLPLERTNRSHKDKRFTPLPPSQRIETESSVTESWITPAPEGERPKTKAKAAPEAPQTAAVPSAASTAARDGQTTPDAPTPRQRAPRPEPVESYSVPTPQEAGDANEESPSPDRPRKAAQGPQTAPTTEAGAAKGKRRWDGSGTSGAPTVEPNTAQP